MEILAEHVTGKQFKAFGSSEFPTVIDAKVSSGGTGLGANPMELVLMAVATCSGMDINSILDKMKSTYDRFQISVRGEQATVDPRVFTKVEIIYRFWGDSLDQKKIERAIDLTLDKYCSVAIMVKQTATISYVLELNPL